MTTASPSDSPTGSPTAASTDAPATFLDRVRRRFAAGPSDGRLGPTVDAARALELVRAGATLLDVRENSEWTSGHAPAAMHVPLARIDSATRRLRTDRPVVVVCASGMRSRTAATHLRGLGFDATSLSGGMAMWQRAGGEVRR
ncbi:rhodanese-like domain-containing protein [Pengzhenrongella sicca]|uniref:rhodanese-like domain-containing protein n=1 Tax=Pengzhenrongella sicca TaxID=2819238 RepID=UPI001D0C9A93|nr:rhodanese-like domain-containing protein [Pengzhenrongella sicca]